MEFNAQSDTHTKIILLSFSRKSLRFTEKPSWETIKRVNADILLNKMMRMYVIVIVVDEYWVRDNSLL